MKLLSFQRVTRLRLRRFHHARAPVSCLDHQLTPELALPNPGHRQCSVYICRGPQNGAGTTQDGDVVGMASLCDIKSSLQAANTVRGSSPGDLLPSAVRPNLHHAGH